jgi:hypothetical protein
MIGQSAEAAQHHVFIARQSFTRPKCGLPLALQDGDVTEHFGVEFPGRSFGGNHEFPTAQAFCSTASNAGGLNAL